MRKKWILLPVLLLLTVIWGNSLLTGETSGAISGGLLKWLIDTFPFLSWLPEVLLRKLGHFSEFGLLGMLLAGYFLDQRGIHRFSVPLLCAMLAANMDETIQVLIPGRGPSVVDVWIDVAGACTGMAVFYLGYTIIKRKRKGKTT